MKREPAASGRFGKGLRTLFFLSVAACVWTAPFEAQQRISQAARVWEAQLVLPTYELGPPDPNPAFADWQGRSRRPVYPYPMLDNLTDRRVDKTYRAINIENEYLRVTVLPELGGHLYAIFDKTANRDVLYINHVVKYGLVAIRGAWVSGGIEWNFPDGHTVTTVSPIDYSMQTGPDGSAAVTVGDTERIQRMQWAVTVRLYPGRKLVETTVTLHNRRPTPGRYWYWSTAAAPATDDLRFVYPMREAYPHTFWPVFSFPKEKGIDLSTYREVPNALSLFARNSKRDFFGVYYEKSDWGIVHVADHRELAGKKTWTWGTAPSGSIWVDKLTEKDGQYVEFQAGRFETQMEHEFIAPHRIEHFVEYWCPLDKLGGGWDEANRDAALRLEMAERRARLTLNVTARFDDAELRVEREGDSPYKQRVSLSPSRAFSISVDLGIKGAGKPLGVRLISKEGREIISYRTDMPRDGNPDFTPARRPAGDPPVSSSADQAYRDGVAADKKSNERAARAAYQETLKRDPGYSPALVSLGLSYYRSGEYEKSENQLLAALNRNKDSADAHYYLGLVLRAQGRVREAADHLIWNVRSGQREAEARYLLGEMSLAAGKPNEAVEYLAPAVQLSRGLKILTVYALAERLAGDLDGARRDIDSAVGSMPLDYFALHERYLICKAAGKEEAARQSWDELWRLLSREPDSVLELVFDYSEAGQTEECRRVLEEAIHRATAAKQPVFPMIHYALGYCLELRGDKAAAGEQYSFGARGNPALVFPHRPEELVILRAAFAANRGDGRAAYYLGNALAALGRGEETLPFFASATQNDKANPVAWRNFAMALWRVAGNREEAARAYASAIALAPDDYHCYVERDELLRSMGATAKRIQLLEATPDQVRSRSAVVQALAAAYVESGRFTDAARLLERARITSGEGEAGGLSIYRRACLGLARQYRKEGKHAEAAAQFLKATEYPPNFGVGRSSTTSHARELVAAARELEAAGNSETAGSLWRRAADEPLKSPVEPGEPWSEHYYYKALALEHTGQKEDARARYGRLAGLADDQQMKLAEPTPPGGALRFLLAGLGLKALGRQEQARAALSRALQLDPANELAKEELASLEELKKKESPQRPPRKPRKPLDSVPPLRSP
jgi:tetratricopeptide (TPR) repeat protein